MRCSGLLSLTNTWDTQRRALSWWQPWEWASVKYSSPSEIRHTRRKAFGYLYAIHARRYIYFSANVSNLTRSLLCCNPANLRPVPAC